MLPYEKRGPPSSNIDKGSHREFLIKHDMSLRCVVTYNRLSFNTYHDGCWITELHLSCQSDTSNTEAISHTIAVNGDLIHFTYEISKTTELIELKFSGIIEGTYKLAVLKFQSNLIMLSIKLNIWQIGN